VIEQLRAEIGRLREGAAALEPDSEERRALGSQALDHALAFLDEVETAPSLRPATEVFS
jgi:aromatic-L-amino-acid decarboxylase